MSSNSNDRAMYVRLGIFGLIVLVLGIAAYGGIWLAESRIEATARWPKTSGEIVRSEVTTSVVRTGRVRNISDVATIYYAYTVDGRGFKCDRSRVVPMLHFTPEGEPDELVRRYPVGRSVDVYYNPNDPSDALLIPLPAEDALGLIRTAAFMAPCVALVGLLIAGIAGLNLTSEAPRSPETQRGIGADAPVQTELAEVVRSASAATKPVEPRALHWLLRGAAVFCGLILMLFGSPTSVTIARMSDAKIGVAVKVIALLMVGGAVLLGAFLVFLGMRKSKRSNAVIAAR